MELQYNMGVAMTYQVKFTDEAIVKLTEVLGEPDDASETVLEAHITDEHLDEYRQAVADWNANVREEDAEGFPLELRIMLGSPTAEIELVPEPSAA